MKKLFKKISVTCFTLVAVFGITCQTARAQRKMSEANITSVFTPFYKPSAKVCKTDDAYISEGEDFGKVCPGHGKYKTLVYGFGSNVNYGVVIPRQNFTLYLAQMDSGILTKYERADLYSRRLVGQIEWRLAGGLPFAVIVRAEYYKNKGSKTFANPKNKVGEFVFIRGLKGFENLQEDFDAIRTAFNPHGKTHEITDKFYITKGSFK